MRRIKRLKRCNTTDDTKMVMAGFLITQRDMDHLKRACFRDAKRKGVAPLPDRDPLVGVPAGRLAASRGMDFRLD